VSSCLGGENGERARPGEFLRHADQLWRWHGSVADYARACGEAEREPDWGLVEAVRRGLGADWKSAFLGLWPVVGLRRPGE